MEHSQKIEFYKKRQFSEKLNMVIVFLRQNAKSYLKAQLYITGPILLIVNLLASKSRMNLFDFQAMGADPDAFITDFYASYGPALIISIFAVSILPTVTYSYMWDYHEEAPGELSFQRIWRKSLKKFGPILGYTLMYMLIFVFAGFIFFIVGSLMGPFAFVLFFLIGLAAMAFVGTNLSLGTSAILFDNKNPFDAMYRSVQLIRGKWWSTFGLIIVTLIIAYLINALFSLPFTIAFGIWAFNSIETASGTLDMSDPPMYIQVVNVVAAIFGTFGTIISSSVIYLALAFQYFNLVERKESRGLMQRIEQMDEEEQDEEDEHY